MSKKRFTKLDLLRQAFEAATPEVAEILLGEARKLVRQKAGGEPVPIAAGKRKARVRDAASPAPQQGLETA